MALSEPAYDVVANDATAARLALLDEAADLLDGASSLDHGHLESCQALVISKRVPGLEADVIAALRSVIKAAGEGRLGRPKYLVLDFAPASLRPRDGVAAGPPERFDDLTVELSNLVLKAPVVPVALVRSALSGQDLELALTCNLMVAEQGTTFDFDADPLQALGLYGLLAHKIGFVRAERLMEHGEPISAAEMKELLLTKELAPENEGAAALEAFLQRHLRRHNSFHSIYRAQRIVAPSRDQWMARA